MSWLTHGKLRLALHSLRAGPGPALLLLHGLGERSPAEAPAHAAGWPGPVYALDFTGHGDSEVPSGGGYTPEILVADADAALARLGSATLLGRGLGAYVALLLAGARPAAVRGAVLCDGPGAAGGGPAPDRTFPLHRPRGPRVAPDPYALVELACDVRPPEYALCFAGLAGRAGLERPVAVCARERPPWLAAVTGAPGAWEAGPATALAFYASP